MLKLSARWLLLAALWAGCLPAFGQTKAEVQAAFLYNFAKFVDWPPSAFTNTNSPYEICVLGKEPFNRDPFGAFLDDLEKGGKLNGRAFKVRRIVNVSEARNAHILFIASMEARRVEEILIALQGQPILTVSEIEDFAARKGGMIQFTTNAEGKIRFEINDHAARRANLRISSQLLNLATAVYPPRR